MKRPVKGKLSKSQLVALKAAGVDISMIPESLKAGNGGGGLGLETKYSKTINNIVNDCRKVIHGEAVDGTFVPKEFSFDNEMYKVSVYVRKLKTAVNKKPCKFNSESSIENYEEQKAFEEKYTEPESSE